MTKATEPLSYHDAMQILNIVKSTQNCSSIRLKFAETTICLERDVEGDLEHGYRRDSAVPSPGQDECVTPLPAATQSATSRDAVASDNDSSAAPQLADINAPMIGFFHHANAADGSVALKIGSQVRAGDAIGMISARQFSAPVLAAVSGELVELLMEDAGFVEYGQVVARVRPVT